MIFTVSPALTADGLQIPLEDMQGMMQEAESAAQKASKASAEQPHVSSTSGQDAPSSSGVEPTKSGVQDKKKASQADVAKAKSVAEGETIPTVESKVLWDMPISGKKINGRYYTKHALERMASDIPQIRAELEARALELGFSRFSEKFKKYVQPRNIPPLVVENIIQHGVQKINEVKGTLTYILDGVKVVTNFAGDVITVHVC